MFIFMHIDARVLKYEREKLGTRESESAKCKAQNFRSKKELESASERGFRPGG